MIVQLVNAIIFTIVDALILFIVLKFMRVNPTPIKVFIISFLPKLLNSFLGGYYGVHSYFSIVLSIPIWALLIKFTFKIPWKKSLIASVAVFVLNAVIIYLGAYELIVSATSVI